MRRTDIRWNMAATVADWIIAWGACAILVAMYMGWLQ